MAVNRIRWALLPMVALVLGLTSSVVQAQTLDPAYSGAYTLFDLGSASTVPPLYGGLTLLAGDPNTLLIGGNANGASGAIYSVKVTRDVNGHITGFNGPATFYASAPYIDGGLSYAPNGDLLYTAYPTNQIGEIKPGSTSPDKLIDLSPLGISSSVGSLGFVPAGFPGAGSFKIASYSGGGFYNAQLVPDGSGTYDITGVSLSSIPGGGPEGITYVPAGSPVFSGPTMLLSQYGANTVSAYQVDANGNPIVASQSTFISGLGGVEGAFTDPLTGDFLFSTFGNGNRIIEVQGFAKPPVGTPEPSTVVSAICGVLVAARLIARRRRSA